MQFGHTQFFDSASLKEQLRFKQYISHTPNPQPSNLLKLN